MKKFLFSLIVMSCFIFLPLKAEAKEESWNLKEAISEEINYYSKNGKTSEYIDKLKELNLDNYKEKESVPTIYLFIGNSCPHCAHALYFLASNYEKYSFNVVVYEVWGNSDNAAHMESVKKEMNISTNGVPLIVVGSKYYVGFSDDKGATILENLNSNDLSVLSEIVQNNNESNQSFSLDSFTNNYFLFNITIFLIVSLFISLILFLISKNLFNIENYFVFIPFYNMYYFGKIAYNKILGGFICLIEVVGFILFFTLRNYSNIIVFSTLIFAIIVLLLVLLKLFLSKKNRS